MTRSVNILGIRGLPAAHGGFETFAAHLALFLRDGGWRVNVYCQIEPDDEGRLEPDYEDEWEGIHRVHLGSRHSSSLGSVIFDWRSTRDSLKRSGVNLVLGYNTAVLTLLLRAMGKKVVMNMDGIEWKRAKWSTPVKAWFYLNEFIGARFANIPIADHPAIAQHLRRHGCRHAVVIPYGAEAIVDRTVDAVYALGLEPDNFLLTVARIEPENSILEIVTVFSSRPRKLRLVILGNFQKDNSYHAAVKAAASADVVFPGAVYDPAIVNALRVGARAYIHGHQVGGTNPSLVEALAAGCAIIVRDNRFNRWVAGDRQFYFSDLKTLDAALNRVSDGGPELTAARVAAQAQHAAHFTWLPILSKYADVLESVDGG